MACPSLNIFTPNIKNRMAAMKLVKRCGSRLGTAWPRTAERTVMVISAEKAAEKTRILSCFMAIKAAMRKVLSPISETRIIVRERINECRGWMRPSTPSASTSDWPVLAGFVKSKWSLWAESGIGCGKSTGFFGSSSGFCIY